MAFRIVWSTDWHISDHPPEMRTDDYTETCFGKIEQVRLICQKTNANLALVGGDIFHVKISSKVRHALVARLVGVLQTFPCPVYTIIGNHDISHNNLHTLPEKPLGVVLQSGALRELRDETFIGGDVRVRVVGRHFDPRIEHNAFDGLSRGDEDWLLVAYHGYASPDGSSYPGETTFRYDKLAKLPVDDWYLGHWHVDQGVQSVDDKNFVNTGSLTRGALTLENLSRNPKAVVASYGKTSRKLQQVKLRIQPSEHVLDVRKKDRTDREQALINDFAEKLQRETAANVDHTEEIEAHLASYKIEKEVRERVASLLEEAELELRH